ncbi:MAG TPA: bifunctional chorismate mutase/prephenate dehydrogenase [Steroidobacteraceae bacterium]|nr:bifunctional chorismate mutase/prephenate dehydrogenase [Steroidobacteraceae bacterium]
MPDPQTLQQLRDRLTEIDRELIALMAERQRLSREVERAKRATGHATRDYRREREVILGVRAHAERQGVSPEVAEQILRLLIRSSLATQEQARVVAAGQGSGRRALVIGGRGKMGRWFADFLASQGFGVEIADPAGPVEGYPHIARWEDSPLEQHLIVVATPLGITAGVLHALAARRPRGLVFDLASVKTPLRAGLDALVRAGVRVTSLHPMFGPDTDLLSGRHVIYINLGDAGALAEAQELFAPTMAEQVVMGLDEHDRLIAYVLGLSHAVNIAFFTALAESGEAAPRLARMSSTTFDAQLEVANRVAEDSPALYFEIQALNEYGTESLTALLFAVERLRATVRSQDSAGFRQMMERGRSYLHTRPQPGREPA